MAVYFTNSKKDFNKKDLKKVTVYYRGDFGINQIEGYLIEAGFQKFAQYDKKPFIEILRKRRRAADRMNFGFGCYCVVVDGWGHPKPNNFKKPEVKNGLVVSEGKYRSCDPRFNSDFDVTLDQSGLTVLYDFRYM